MIEWNPLLKFCELHADTLIRGDNSYGPTGINQSCRAFIWSKLNKPDYQYEFRPDLTCAAPIEVAPAVEKLSLKRATQHKCGPYNLYVLD